tara:strand:- start:3911 stop:5665 length:1755 start_codon:yes stop_codon:yes gene_type:complete
MISTFSKPKIFILFSLFKHIKRKRKIQLFILIFIILASGISELFSIASIIPFLSVLVDQDLIWQNKISSSLFSFFNIKNDSNIIFIVTLLFCIISIVTALIRILNLWLNNKLSSLIGSDLSCDAYEIIMHRPYSYHTVINSSEIINIFKENISYTVYSVNLVLQFITSLFITFSVVSILLVININVTLLISVILSSLYFLIALFTKNRFINNSKKINRLGAKKIMLIQEGHRSIKDVILSRSQATFLDLFKKTEIPLRNSLCQNNILLQFPRYLIEAIGLVSIASLAFYLTKKSNFSTSIIPLLGAFALAAQRLLPSLQQIYRSWSGLNESIYQVESVVKLLNGSNFNSKLTILDNFEFKNSIELLDISYRYANSSNVVFKNLSLKIEKGKKIGFCGETGSGKSTLLDLIMGLLKPSSGKILIDGMDLHEVNESNLLISWRDLIAHVPQSISFLDDSIAQNIAFGVPLEDINYVKIQEAAQKAQIASYIESLDKKYDSLIGEDAIRLSGGQRQRIAIARAIYRQKRILILDESTSALDSYTEKLVIDSIMNSDKEFTIIMVSHKLSTLNNCDIIYKMDNGKILY